MKQHHAYLWFALAVLMAIGMFWYLWTTQAHYGRTVEGVRSLGETWLRREALAAQHPSAELTNVRAENGCCVFLEHPQRGSQLTIDVMPDNVRCFEDKRVESRVKSGYVVVDIESHPCEKKIAYDE